MEKIMKNERRTHLQISWNNADKWEQHLACAVSIRSHRLSHDGTCLSYPHQILQPPAVLEASRQKPNYLQNGYSLQGEIATELSIISQWHIQDLHGGIGNRTEL